MSVTVHRFEGGRCVHIHVHLAERQLSREEWLAEAREKFDRMTSHVTDWKAWLAGRPQPKG